MKWQLLHTKKNNNIHSHGKSAVGIKKGGNIGKDIDNK